MEQGTGQDDHMSNSEELFNTAGIDKHEKLFVCSKGYELT